MIQALHRRGFVIPALVGGAAFALYLATISPGIATVHGSTDSAELVSVAWVLGVAHPPGAAIWLPLGRLALFFAFLTEPALRTNVLSAACMAMAVALVVVAARRWLPATPWWGAALGGALFATAPVPWSQGLITEVLALHALLAAGALALAASRVRRGDTRRWSLLGLVLGLLCWNHPTGLAIAAPLAVAVITTNRPGRRALALAGGGFLAPGVYTVAYLALRAHAEVAWGDTASLHGLWSHLSGAEYRGLADWSPRYVRGSLPPTVRLALQQIPPPLWFAIPVGALASWRVRPALAAALLVSVALLAAFAAVYRATGREDYLAPVAMAGALFAAWGTVEGWRLLHARFHGARLVPALGSALLALILVWGGFQASQVSLRGNTREIDTARALLEAQPPGATIESDRDELTFALWYLRVVRGERSDVTIRDVRGYAPVIRASAEP